jgi:hypothetical protein
VFDDFQDVWVHHHHGLPSGNCAGLHAMVLLAIRHDGVHGRCFLLQNWWLQRQFVEVSEAYFAACGATVYFVETPQSYVAFPTRKGKYVDCEHMDKPEEPPSERML